jgi:hypothetical protein
MPSTQQSETSRQNGAKSHGPVTPEGLANASKNALKPGLTAAVVVLPHEIHDFRPANQSQQDLVEALAATRWRSNRPGGHGEFVCSNKSSIVATDLDDTGKMAFTLNKIKDQQNSGALAALRKQLNRTYDRALKQLKDLQSMQNALGKPNRDSNGAAIPNTQNHLPELPNEPGKDRFPPLHPPETPPSGQQHSEEGVQIQAA